MAQCNILVKMKAKSLSFILIGIQALSLNVLSAGRASDDFCKKSSNSADINLSHSKDCQDSQARGIVPNPNTGNAAVMRVAKAVSPVTGVVIRDEKAHVVQPILSGKSKASKDGHGDSSGDSSSEE